jgi:hypothetical protein
MLKELIQYFFTLIFEAAFIILATSLFEFFSPASFSESRYLSERVHFLGVELQAWHHLNLYLLLDEL